MDIENLIADLQEISQKNSISHYKRGRCAAAAIALSTLQAENAQLRAELERMKKIMRDNGIMVIPSKYPGGRSEWNIPKPRG